MKLQDLKILYGDKLPFYSSTLTFFFHLENYITVDWFKISMPFQINLALLYMQYI